MLTSWAKITSIEMFSLALIAMEDKVVEDETVASFAGHLTNRNHICDI